MHALCHLLGYEVDAKTQTSEAPLHFRQDVGEEDHDHEWVRVADDKAIDLKSPLIFLFKDLNEGVSVLEDETWLERLQQGQFDLRYHSLVLLQVGDQGR